MVNAIAAKWQYQVQDLHHHHRHRRRGGASRQRDRKREGGREAELRMLPVIQLKAKIRDSFPFGPFQAVDLGFCFFFFYCFTCYFLVVTYAPKRRRGTRHVGNDRRFRLVTWPDQSDINIYPYKLHKSSECWPTQLTWLTSCRQCVCVCVCVVKSGHLGF